MAVAWLSLGSGRQGLVAVALVDAVAALLASSLWAEEADPVSSRLGWSPLGVALLLAGLSVWLLLSAHRSTHPAPVFAILLDRNPSVPARHDPDTARLLYRARARSGVAPASRNRKSLWRSWA